MLDESGFFYDLMLERMCLEHHHIVEGVPRKLAWKGYTDRRVNKDYIIPSKSHLYSVNSRGKSYRYDNKPGFEKDGSPAGLYPAIILTNDFVGKLVRVRIIKEEAK